MIDGTVFFSKAGPGAASPEPGDPCPECEGPLVHRNGCKECKTCGYSSCG